MIVDCESCAVRGDACGECVIGVLLGFPEPADAAPRRSDMPSGALIVQLDAPERRALDVLAEQGLVPRLRLVAGVERRASPETDGGISVRDVG
jgi:hypothetical protein